MKIGIVSLGNISQDTGGRNYLINITKALAKVNRDQNLSHRFTIYLTKGQKFLIEDYLDENFRVIEVPPASNSSVMKVFGEQVLMPIYLLFSDLDVVYCPGNFSILLSPKPTVVAIRSMLQYHIPEALDSQRRLIRKLLTPLSAKLSKAIITPSQTLKKDIKNLIRVNESKIHVINHGVDQALFQKEYNESTRNQIFQKYGITKPYIVYASALWPYKNQHMLILSLKKLVEDHNLDIQLVLAGQGANSFATYQTYLHSLISEYGFEKRVILTGHLSHDELKYLYKYAEISAFPSSCESFGNPLFEAWAAGVPIVCSNVHAFPEMTLEGKCAVMVNPKDIDELSSALYSVITDQVLREQLIQNGLFRIKDFSWQKCVSQTLAVLESVGRNKK